MNAPILLPTRPTPQIDRGLEDDARDLAYLAERAGLSRPSFDYPLTEKRLDAVAFDLRRQWLAASHRPGDETMKSPCEGTKAWLPQGECITFGYERELDASALERRSPLEYETPPGWTSERLLCRSGQAALSCLFHLVASRLGDDGPLSIFHAGRYFESISLLDLWPKNVFSPAPPDASAVDVLLGEPVYCDGQFGIARPSALPKIKRALLLDTTLVGSRVSLAPWFERVEGPLVAVFRSGLKLDQAGLELANAGILQVFVREGEDSRKIAELLRRVRALTGSGLTLDEMAALSAPWFLDAAYFRHYGNAVFAHNEKLARAVDKVSRVFEARSHPCLEEPTAVAPFCVFRLRRPTIAAYRYLLERLERDIGQRGIDAVRGGSFGFRGHRYELVEPEGSPAFLRVAMGYRAGRSMQALIELLTEIAADERSLSG